MPSSFEAEIHLLLREHVSPGLVAEELLRRWNLKLLSPEEQIDCAQFLIASGQYATLFRTLQTLISEKAQLPWAQIAEAVGRARIKPEPLELQAILDGASRQNQMSALLLSRQLDVWSRAFVDRRVELESIRQTEREERKKELKEKIEFVRASRLPKEEARILSEAQALFPEETVFRGERVEFEMRKAREVLSRSIQDEALELKEFFERLPPEAERAKDMIVTRAQEMAKSDPRLAFDLALNLHFMDFNSEALTILDIAAPSPSADWLRLELMILARQFASALEEALRLELEYADDPDAVFAVAYARARALHGLGQIESAGDLMRGLVKVRPQYRQAQSLLSNWTGGDE